MKMLKTGFAGLLLAACLAVPVLADFTTNNALCAAGAVTAKDCGAPPVLTTHSNTSAPSTPASGKTAVWTDSSDKNLKAKSDAGNVTVTVKPTASSTHNFVTGISSDGTVTKAQPSASDLTGLAASATTDTTSASNISSGTLGSARGGAGAVSGIMKANGSGVVSAATSGTDYAPATSGSAILKGNGSGGFTAATSGTDYAPVTSGTSILQGNGSGGFSNVTVGSGLNLTTGTLTATGAVSSVFGRSGAVTAATNDYSFSQISGNISASQMNSGTSATNTTFWRGDGVWATPAGAGNVSGPGSSTNNNLAAFDGTSGTLLKDSGIASANVVTASGTMTNHGLVVGTGSKGAAALSVMTNGQLAIGQTGADPAPTSLSQDCTLAASGAITCTKTNNVSFGTFATGTDAANLTGTISVNRFNSGTGASSSTFLRGDGTWVAAGGSPITSSSANAFAVGANGTTNPAFNVDASTASSATGINIKSAAAGAAVAVSVISSGTNENLTISAKGSGSLTLQSAGTGNTVISNALTMGTSSVIGIDKNELAFAGTSFNGFGFNDTSLGGGVNFVVWRSGGSAIGTIASNGGATGMVYNTTSDERLKNWQSVSQHSYRQKIEQLWVGDYIWKQNGIAGFGVRAQQAYRVLGKSFGITPPANPKDRWTAPAEPFAFLALHGVKDLYHQTAALQTQVTWLIVAIAALTLMNLALAFLLFSRRAAK